MLISSHPKTEIFIIIFKVTKVPKPVTIATWRGKVFKEPTSAMEHK